MSAEKILALAVALLWTVPLPAQDQVSLTVNATSIPQRYVLDWVQPKLSSYPPARYAVGMAYEATSSTDATTSSIVLFGGQNLGPPYGVAGDTWLWRNGWTQVFPAASPPARYSPGAAYDPTTRTVLLFGGTDATGNDLNDTWTWNGVTWTQQFPPVSPPPRAFDAQSMVYDAVTETIVLFGGQGGSYGDTWEWNGRTKTWKQDFPASSPSPRNTTLAYDPPTGEVVLFGGNNPNAGPYLNDTWTWDGLTWTQRFPASSPSPRGAPAFIYDPYLGRVVLFGGTPGDFILLNDTWVWNGVTWTQLHTPNQPSGRFAAGIAVDPLNGGLLLFGAVSTVDTWFLVPVPVP